MSTLFISDLHLQPSRPALSRLFLDFLDGPARDCRALYILGDLFEYWIGDDGSMGDYPAEVAALQQLTASGLPVTFVPGNRDFLVGDQFAEETRIAVRKGVSQILVEGTDCLILHGDELCTDDVSHQEFRRVALNPDTQAAVLALPVEQRRQMAESLRKTSKTGNKSSEIMDVNEQAVLDCLLEHGQTQMIHGHTHRPAVHRYVLEGKTARRFVLTDWSDTQGGYLECAAADPESWQLRPWPG